MSKLQELRLLFPSKASERPFVWHAASYPVLCVPWVLCPKARSQSLFPWLALPLRVSCVGAGPASTGSPGCAPSDTRWAFRQLSWPIISCYLILCIHNPCPFDLTKICEGSLRYWSEKLGSLVWCVSLVPRTEQAETMLRRRIAHVNWLRAGTVASSSRGVTKKRVFKFLNHSSS